MHMKFPATVMVSEVVSSEGHLIPPYFSSQGLRINDAGCIDVLEIVINPLNDEVCDGSHTCFNKIQHLTKLSSAKNGCEIIFTIM